MPRHRRFHLMPGFSVDVGVIPPSMVMVTWRGGRVAEGNGLLNRRRDKISTEGSNPSLSATRKRKARTFCLTLLCDEISSACGAS